VVWADAMPDAATASTAPMATSLRVEGMAKPHGGLIASTLCGNCGHPA
jgi:hypothetical protein